MSPKPVRPIKPLHFIGASRDELRAFPDEARSRAGVALFAEQIGEAVSIAKPITSVVPNLRELKIRADNTAFRVAYIVSFPEAVYVLLAWNKKRDDISTAEAALIRSRYALLLKQRADERR